MHIEKYLLKKIAVKNSRFLWAVNYAVSGPLRHFKGFKLLLCEMNIEE